ncbi:MAG TPA: hypothetical protein VEO18_08365 [Thermoplasmata archaeon]|nr:hypothetical protein [Thermoplasmata archaeon]
MGRNRSGSFYIPIWYGGTPEERLATPSNTYVRTEGMTVVLADGTALEDWTGQAFVNNIGMGRPEVAKALADQARVSDSLRYDNPYSRICVMAGRFIGTSTSCSSAV